MFDDVARDAHHTSLGGSRARCLPPWRGRSGLRRRLRPAPPPKRARHDVHGRRASAGALASPASGHRSWARHRVHIRSVHGGRRTQRPPSSTVVGLRDRSASAPLPRYHTDPAKAREVALRCLQARAMTSGQHSRPLLPSNFRNTALMAMRRYARVAPILACLAAATALFLRREPRGFLLH